MIQTFGDVINEPPNYQEEIVLEILPSPTIPFSQRWRNNSLSADFLADYLTTFLPFDVEKQEELKNTISYIANELLENAMKFNDKTSQHSIRIKLRLYSDNLLFFVTNSISLHTMAVFQAKLQKLTNNDPQELWVEQLKNNLKESNQSESGLGLLTMFLHYEAKLRWQFENFKTDPKVVVVTTIVQLAI
ncbi:MAG: ATP-binding protein [Candidatus Parabeggiatoa sp. nov. 1]|nr:MAG: ATP-binding protein [Gammaproteobacteria bacterium]